MSFAVQPGEIVGFAGPNGAGKTTVIKMLTGILKPAQGRVLIHGHDIVREPLVAKRAFAYVADDPDVLLQLSGAEYIHYVADIYGVSEKDRADRVQALTERFGMADALGMPMREYSHGMRQKTMIIAALIHNPPAWILDEPMTGLDPAAAYELKQLMKEHAANGNAVLFSTHVLEVAEKLCDRILILHHGQSVYQGTMEQLKTQHPQKSLEEIFIGLTSG